MTSPDVASLMLRTVRGSHNAATKDLRARNLHSDEEMNVSLSDVEWKEVSQIP